MSVQTNGHLINFRQSNDFNFKNFKYNGSNPTNRKSSQTDLMSHNHAASNGQMNAKRKSMNSTTTARSLKTNPSASSKSSTPTPPPFNGPAPAPPNSTSTPTPSQTALNYDSASSSLNYASINKFKHYFQKHLNQEYSNSQMEYIKEKSSREVQQTPHTDQSKYKRNHRDFNSKEHDFYGDVPSSARSTSKSNSFMKSKNVTSGKINRRNYA